MERSPGHRNWPEHTVREVHVDREMEVHAAGELIADSDDVIRLVEDDHPDRFYFPRSDVRMEHLHPSDRTTECPFKGNGRYFDIEAEGRTLDDAAWSYEDTYEEHRDLEDRIAFHGREMQTVEVGPAD